MTTTAILGDITKVAVDGILNAAKPSLLGGSGVDGAIHQAAGPELVAACRLLGGCKTGLAKITPGFRLPSRWVIHTVGPVWHGGQNGEAEALASCYRASLELAESHQMQSLAFPCISTGVYGYPSDLAAKVAIATVRAYPLSNGNALKVIFVCFDSASLGLYQQYLGEQISVSDH